jgi:hypothetical protein
VFFPNGDTIPGAILMKQKFIENNYCEIKFTSENGMTKDFKAGMISGFGIEVNQYDEVGEPLPSEIDIYESHPSFKKGEPVFYKVLLNGRIKVLMNRSSGTISSTKEVTRSKMDGIGFSYNPGEGLSIGPTYKTSTRVIESRTRCTSYYVVKNNMAIVKISKDNYNEIFPTLFGDCQSIEQEIAKNPDLKLFKTFMILAEIYNQICE